MSDIETFGDGSFVFHARISNCHGYVCRVVVFIMLVFPYYSTLAGQDVLGHLWALRMSSYWAETHFIDISMLYVYCVTALLQEIVRISARSLTRTQIIVFVGARYKHVRIQVLS